MKRKLVGALVLISGLLGGLVSCDKSGADTSSDIIPSHEHQYGGGSLSKSRAAPMKGRRSGPARYVGRRTINRSPI